jgi:intracellular sulfur oxidation DsrE/DsrF family protein
LDPFEKKIVSTAEYYKLLHKLSFMRIIMLLALSWLLCLNGFSQKYNIDSSMAAMKFQKDSTLKALKWQRDSTYHAQLHADSVKTDKEFAEGEKWEKLKAVAIYPAIKGSENSGVIPVKDPTEIPDPNIEYKLLFELTSNNPDSIAKEINGGLAEVARVINLHVASGVPVKKIIPVIVVHAGALHAFTTNVHYKEKYKLDNPNLKLINDLKDLGAKFIACGQAMAFLDIKKEDLLPVMKVSITAQTVLSHYQLKGYVLYK